MIEPTQMSNKNNWSAGPAVLAAFAGPGPAFGPALRISKSEEKQLVRWSGTSSDQTGLAVGPVVPVPKDGTTDQRPPFFMEAAHV